MSFQSSIYLHGVNCTNWGCLVNRLFISIVSRLLIGSALSIDYFSPWCHGTHWECLVNRLFICMVSVVLIWSALSIVHISPWSVLSIILSPCVTATRWRAFVNRPLISIVSMVLIGSVNRLFISIVSMVLFGYILSIVYSSQWFHGYLLGVSCQSSIYLHGVNGTY